MRRQEVSSLFCVMLEIYKPQREEWGLMVRHVKMTHLKGLCVSRHLPSSLSAQRAPRPDTNPTLFYGYFPLSAGCEIIQMTHFMIHFYILVPWQTLLELSVVLSLQGHRVLISLCLLHAASSKVRADSSLASIFSSGMRLLFLYDLLTNNMFIYFMSS